MIKHRWIVHFWNTAGCSGPPRNYSFREQICICSRITERFRYFKVDKIYLPTFVMNYL